MENKTENKPSEIDAHESVPNGVLNNNNNMIIEFKNSKYKDPEYWKKRNDETTIVMKLMAAGKL